MRMRISQRDRKIYLLHIKGMTFAELGLMYGVTRQRAGQIYNKVSKYLTKIKAFDIMRK